MVEVTDPSRGRGTDETDWGTLSPASYNPACTGENHTQPAEQAFKALSSIKNALEAEELKM